MTVKRITIALVCILAAAVLGALILGRQDNSSVSVSGDVSRTNNTNTNTNTVTSDKWVYEAVDGSISLVGYNGRDSVIEIPSEIDGVPVTSLGEGLFEENNRLREVTIPDSVTDIGPSSFENCTELTVVRLSANIERIQSKAFSG